MARIAGLLLALAVVSCASSRPLDAAELQAVHATEAFVLRHGYTVVGHPADKPVENAEVLDLLATPEQLVEWRRSTLCTQAFGVAKVDDGAYYVLFDWVRDAEDGFRAVLVQKGEAVQVVHTVMLLKGLPWEPVSPSKQVQRTVQQCRGQPEPNSIVSR